MIGLTDFLVYKNNDSVLDHYVPLYSVICNTHFPLTQRETATSGFNGPTHGLPTARRELLPVAVRGTGEHDVVAIGRSGRTFTGWIVLQWTS